MLVTLVWIAFVLVFGFERWKGANKFSVFVMSHGRPGGELGRGENVTLKHPVLCFCGYLFHKPHGNFQKTQSEQTTLANKSVSVS